ncbi:P-loop containing nucleoside triphosphate hydrolase protein [Baffinella frigidus]|nr:P-loop containing nucleoside triphosphate hydrolase protein [Cryptophyta sp. CCMP2293]
MDEAHERSLNTDILLALLRRILLRRRDLRLVVTSATMDAAKFSRFFDHAPVLEVEGRTFPVDIVFSDERVMDFVREAVAAALRVHPEPGDVLVFMPGQEEVSIPRKISIHRFKGVRKLQKVSMPEKVLPIFGALPADAQARIFSAASKGCRKVVVATNIAETSLTVPGVAFVIDSGACPP